MKELNIENLETVFGGRCSIADMSFYAYMSNAAPTAELRLAFTYMLWDCMAQI
jgi:hypothetical protein